MEVQIRAGPEKVQAGNTQCIYSHLTASPPSVHDLMDNSHEQVTKEDNIRAWFTDGILWGRTANVLQLHWARS